MARIFFTRFDDTAGTELWVSDGIAARRVKDIRPGTAGSSPSDFVLTGDMLLFAADDGASGKELWRTDGTASNTFLVKDIWPGPSGSSPDELTHAGFDPFFVPGEQVFFAANDGANGTELWITIDGRRSLTSLVHNNLGPSGSNPGASSFLSYLTDVDGTLFYTANFQLWKSDGSSAGTVPVKPGAAGNPVDLTSFNSALVFSALDSDSRRKLWISDGTDAGTKVIHDVDPTSPGAFTEFHEAGGRLFFSGNDHTHGAELWMTDSTEAGTSMVADIRGGSAGSFDGMTPTFAHVGSTVYFLADDGVHGRELWKSDGTAATLVKDINPGSAGNSSGPTPQPLVTVGGTVFFAADDGVHGRELWKTDGTEAGTSIVKDIAPGTAPSSLFSLINIAGTLYFGFNDASGSGLWKTDGTEGGTVKIINGFQGAIIGDGGFVPIHQFQQPAFQLAAFAPDAGGWTSDNAYPRELADVNGDDMDDIVGFGEGGVYVARATGGGSFAAPSFPLAAFAPGAGGWISEDRYPRELADVNGDGVADIVGFGEGGVYVSLATGGGNFAAPSFSLAAFAPGAGGWVSDDRYPRKLADVNGDSMADIVGFGEGGVYVALATGGGNFAAPSFRLAAFGPSAGGWVSADSYPRELGDVNGDNMDDIVAFGEGGVYVALATGGGNFAAPLFTLAGFGPSAGGWVSDDRYPRQVADVNGDGFADIVGFGEDGVYLAYSNGDGSFQPVTTDLAGYAPAAGGWSSDDAYPRELADVTGDGAADIVGFGQGGVYVSLSHGLLMI